MRNRVLIADYGNWKSLMSVPYLFAKAGCEVDVFGLSDSWLAKGSYHARHIAAPADAHGYVEALAAIADSYDLVVPGDDETIRMIAQSDNAALQAKALPVPAEHRDFLGSKAGFSEAMSRSGILTPRYLVYRHGLLLAEIGERVGYPMLLKLDESGSGKGIFLCNAESELTDRLAALSESAKRNLIVQEFVDGDTISIDVIYRHGVPVAHAAAKVTKTLDSAFGIASEREYFTDPATDALVRDLGAAIPIHGFCNMTAIRRDGVYLLVEADVRPQAWFALGRCGGTDFVAGVRTFLSDSGAPVRTILKPGERTMVYHFPRDIAWHIRNKRYAGLVPWVYNGGGRWRTILWHDRRLLAAYAARGVRYAYTRIFRHFNSV